ncbi:MAG: GAF domain-containing protein, partial [Bacteroidota bacterium]
MKGNRFRRKANKTMRKIRKWAESAPQNFAHKHLMIQALLEKAAGKTSDALTTMEAAIASAVEQKYVQNAAMGCEFAAQYCQELGQNAEARAHLTAAYDAYQRWGGTFKTQQLAARYPDIGLTTLSTKSASPTSRSEGISQVASIDLASIFKAARGISGEISLKGVLTRLMTILLENAGAERALLMLEQDGRFLIQAAGDAQSGTVEVLQARPAHGSDQVPETILNYVSRSLKPVVLSDARQDQDYGTDPYIRAQQPLSLLCMPILNQSRLDGVLYLENNLAAGAFTRERLDVLDILAAQAAISIENATLYSDLEDRVEARTRELQETLEDLRATQDQLIQSEKLASLGQVTAGIAHEIRNPLNFVNNFSELSVEIAAELREEIEALQGKPLDEEGLKLLFEYLDDLSENASKIQHHGKRAESIVHNMLLHAAAGTDEKTPVSLNKLINEYVLRAYHAIRGKHPDFSCALNF